MTIREQSDFMRIRDDLFGDDEGFRLFQNALINNPDLGKVISGGGGIRKVRWLDPLRGKGKRGGIRVIYYYVPEFFTILLIFAYNKNTDDISPGERRKFRIIAHDFRLELEEEHRKG